MARTMLSTSDNPYNPFTQYDLWSSYDEAVCGYYTSSFLARLTALSPDFSRVEMDAAIEDAVDDAINTNIHPINPLTGKEVNYVKVVESE